MPRAHPTIAHLDLDAFFAAVEQRDKPSLRGRPVVVGGLGPRGVVSTASYEARAYGVASAMATAQARARCPYAAYLYPRFEAYREASRIVMGILAQYSTLIEPLSLDEAFVDLEAGPYVVDDAQGARAWATEVKDRIREATGGLTASAGLATSKMMAKVASDLDKPDGLVVVDPGSECDLLAPMSIRVIPGVGPASAERLRRAGATTVADVREMSEREVVLLLGQAHGSEVARLVNADDDRPVNPERPTKSISVEDTYDTDLTDPADLRMRVSGLAARVVRRLGAAGLSGRTVTVKVRMYDFTTVNRSWTLPGPTDDSGTVTSTAIRLLAELDCSSGVRLLGVAVSGLTDWVQDELFADPEATDGNAESEPIAAQTVAAEHGPADRTFADRFPGASGPGWRAGEDVVHADHGPGWVWGSGRSRVTVRFETADSGPGPIHTFAIDDPALSPRGRS